MIKEQIESIKRLHKKYYKNEAEVISYAPGRAEILGNHTDYNQGTVLSTAINMGHCFAISKNSGAGLRLMAGDIEKIVEFDINQVSPVKEAGWASYVKGVFYYLAEKGLKIENWDCTFLGTIPIGSGLSSSAALEVSSAYAAQEMCNFWLDKIEVAKLCRESESRFAGCNCGLLDQFSSIFGKEHSLIHSDFRNLEVRSVSIPDEIIFLMVTPEVTHSLVDSPYNERRESCELAVKEINELTGKNYNFLRDIPLDDFKKNRDKISTEAAKRASHIVGEIDRVELGVKALNRGDIKQFGEYMFQSHNSSRYDFENSSEDLDKIVEAAKDANALGARLSGGGWGGSLIVIVEEKKSDHLSKKISKLCDKMNLKTTIRKIRPSDGARILKGRN